MRIIQISSLLFFFGMVNAQQQYFYQFEQQHHDQEEKNYIEQIYDNLQRLDAEITQYLSMPDILMDFFTGFKYSKFQRQIQQQQRDREYYEQIEQKRLNIQEEQMRQKSTFFEQNLEKVNIYESKGSSIQQSNFQPNNETTSIFKAKQRVENHNNISNRTRRRNLKGSNICLNGGREVPIKVPVEICNDPVNRTDPQSGSTSFILKSLFNFKIHIDVETYCSYTFTGCYCPWDYYGEKCEKWNQIECDIEQAELDCPYYDENYFVSKYGGQPPCTFVNRDDDLTLSFKIENCSHANGQQIINGEGVDFAILTKYNAWDEAQNWSFNFDYEIEDEKQQVFNPLISNYLLFQQIWLSHDPQLHFKIKFVNWNRIDLQKEFKTKMNSMALIGGEYATLDLNMKDNGLYPDFMFVGRYSFFGQLISEKYDINLGTNLIQGAIEDKEWVEPKSMLYIYFNVIVYGGSFLGVILIFITIFCYLRIKDQKAKFEKREQERLRLKYERKRQ